jgi:hypothetical protein
MVRRIAERVGLRLDEPPAYAALGRVMNEVFPDHEPGEFDGASRQRFAR